MPLVHSAASQARYQPLGFSKKTIREPLHYEISYAVIRTTYQSADAMTSRSNCNLQSQQRTSKCDLRIGRCSFQYPRVPNLVVKLHSMMEGALSALAFSRALTQTCTSTQLHAQSNASMQAAVELQGELDTLGPDPEARSSEDARTEVSHTSTAVTRGVRVQATR